MSAATYWIGGGSGSGKSTLAVLLAERYGLQVYSTDDVMSDHAARLDPRKAPQLAAFMTMDMDERWVHREPGLMLETFHWFRGEGFELILEDLAGIRGAVVVEGFRLLPDLVQPHLGESSHAVWLLPTPAFRQQAFRTRGTLWDIPGRTSDPPRALRNLLERDRLFTERLQRETERLGLPSILVDGETSLEESLRRLAEVLRLPV